mmetsp:Transcript_32031/g.95959  ORF Transcript_32031/g.95959 Transcript_32031/m.95959 type:complete len:274 (+) Transcript_32031:559-1380(+)
MSGPQLHRYVNVGHGRVPPLGHQYRLHQAGDEETIHDETWSIPARDAHLSNVTHPRLGPFEDGGIRPVRRYDLDQFHDLNGIEEVNADEIFGPAGYFGHLRDGQGRRVGREYRLGLADLSEGIAVQILLEVHILDDGLDDHVDVGQIGRIGGVRYAPQRFVGLLRGDLTLFEKFAHRSFDPLPSTIEILTLGLEGDDGRVRARRRGDLTDSVAHETQSDDSDLIEGGHGSGGHGGQGGGRSRGDHRRDRHRPLQGGPRPHRHGSGGCHFFKTF